MRFAGFFVIVILWLILADWTQSVSTILLPPLASVMQKLYDLTVQNRLWQDVSATLWRWCIGFTLGVVSGTVCGLFLGVSRQLYRAVELPLEFFRAMPVTALFPLFLVFFGIGDESKIAMIFFPTFLLMIINACYGVKHATPERLRMAFVFGATPWQQFTRVIWPEALPQIFIGMRLALSLSLIVTVVSEMFIGTDYGLGQRVYDSYLTSSITTLYAILIVLGLMGYGLNKTLLKIEKHLIFWAGK
jgi:NitT/TauT family transport system permease protein